MSNTDLMNIDAFKNVAPASAFAAQPIGESLAEGIGSSYGIIGYRGKAWSLRYRGETHYFTRPDDGSPLAYLDVIIVRSAPNKSKSYYPAGSFDQNASGERPKCASIDGITPDDDVMERQAQACAICPRNAWTTNAEGRKSRECADFKRLAVLVLPTLTQPLLGAPLMEPVFLRVPAASLNDLAVFGEAMQKQGYSYFSFITRIGFVADKAHPQMTFRALQPLTDNEAPVVLEARSDNMALRITGEDQKPGTGGGPVTAAVNTGFIQHQPAATGLAQSQPAVQVQQPQVQVQPQVQQPQVQQAQPATVNTGFGTTTQTKPAAATGMVDTGFGSGQPVQQTQQQTVQHAQPMANPSAMDATADTGAASESDESLDALVAGILKTPS